MSLSRLFRSAFVRWSVCTLAIVASSTLVACTFQDSSPGRRATGNGDDSADDDDETYSSGDNAGSIGKPDSAPAAATALEISGHYTAYPDYADVQIVAYPSFPAGTDESNLPRLSGVSESTIALPEVGGCAPTLAFTLSQTELKASVELDDPQACASFKRGLVEEGLVVTIAQAPRASGAPIDVKINLLAN